MGAALLESIGFRGAVLSGRAYQTHGLPGCLWWCSGMLLTATLSSIRLPPIQSAAVQTGGD